MWSQGYVGDTFSCWYPGRDRGIAQVPSASLVLEDVLAVTQRQGRV